MSFLENKYMKTIGKYSIIFLLIVYTTNFCKQLMAAKTLTTTLYSIVYVTVPNITVGQQIARFVLLYAFCYEV